MERFVRESPLEISQQLSRSEMIEKLGTSCVVVAPNTKWLWYDGDKFFHEYEILMKVCSRERCLWRQNTSARVADDPQNVSGGANLRLRLLYGA